MQSKKQLILWVLNLLNNESDERHPITQTKMAEIISLRYPCDRKTVCRNLKFLQEMGYPIKKTKNGFYMDKRAFSLSEIEFIKSAIKGASGGDAEKEELADRVADILTKAYRR